MIRRYKFFGKEEVTPVFITYDFPQPFEENLDFDLKSQYGEDLTFVKEINHVERIIRLHSAYNSGKGTKYIAPLNEPNRERIDIKLKRILSNVETNILELQMTGKANMILVFLGSRVQVFKNATVINKNVGGYTQGFYHKEELLKYLLRIRYYPDTFIYHQ